MIDEDEIVSPHVGPEEFVSLIVDEFEFDDDDMWLIAMLKDPVLSVEFCWQDPNNLEYSGTYKVRDYQVAFNRRDDHYLIHACARSVGKTEKEIGFAFTHFFRRLGENLLITAPELLHLKPLAKAVEDRIEGCRLHRECLKRDRPGKTGFSHNPFGVEYTDGTQIVGRIPKRDGSGLKGQHQRSLIVEEGQDFPDPGYVEVNETLTRDDDFHFHIYGVHRGMSGGEFAKRATGGLFKLISLTAIQRPTWSAEEKAAAIDAYGGTNSPDYRRNILGEPGGASSPIFVLARLMAIIDQNPDSKYNQYGYVTQHFRWEDFATHNMDLESLLDLPMDLKSPRIVVGLDIGLTTSPTVCSIFAEIDYKAQGDTAPRKRLALIRRFTLERFAPKYIRELMFAIWKWKPNVAGIGMDSTGLGFPIFLDIETDESYPDAFKQLCRGFKFNEKIEIPTDQVSGIDPFNATKQAETVQRITVIEATTQFLREWVDSGRLLLPLDKEVHDDLRAESFQRIKEMSSLTGSKKQNRFHILDSFRMAAMIDKMDTFEFEAEASFVPILDSFMGDFGG